MDPKARKGAPDAGRTRGARRFTRSTHAISASSAGFAPLTSIDERDGDTVAEAVDAVRAGDNDAALHYLYVRFSGNVFAYVRTMLHDDHEAEDVTQQVFLKLPAIIDKYRPQGVPFFGWLLRVARNVAYDHLRARRAIAVEEVFGADEQSQDRFESAAELREALATLPHDQREVVVLRHLMGLAPGEIAERMGRTEAAIHGLHHRGRGTLQAQLRRMETAPATRRFGRATAAGGI